MSAIWGAIDFSGKKITENVKNTFKSGFSECAIDKTTEISDGNVYVACGLQYFTPESRREKLPNKEGEVFFTADAVLDNRDEMCSKIGIPDATELPDGEIIRLCFDKFGETCLNDMLGAYTFVKIDRATGKVDVVTDAVGNRYVYYFCEDDVLYFSSLLTPLENIKKDLRINKKWLAYYYGVDTIDIYCDCESTLTEGIYRIAPATHMVFDKTVICGKFLYWDVTKIKRTRRPKTNEEYRKEFIELYRKCVTDTLRTDEEVAIFLSGGYDSTSVACLAAPALKEKGKKLYSLTSVPHRDFVFNGSSNEEAHEAGSARKNMEFLGNVECDSIDISDIDLWDIRKEYNKVIELPYKSPENIIWLYEGYKKARKKGARLILSGAFGNGTVSFNNLRQYLVWMMTHLKFREYIQEVNAFSRKYGSSRKHMLKVTLQSIFTNVNPKTFTMAAYKNSYAFPNFLRENGAIKAVKKRDNNIRKSFINAQKYQNLFLPPINFRHYAEFPFKNSLYTGVQFRDPTRDKRMIEFVKTIPYNQFTHDGYTRALIADYMRDIMPPDFFVKHPFGVQSADLKYRFEQNGDKIMSDWKRIVSTLDFKGIIDEEKLKNDLEKKKMQDLDIAGLVRIFYTINALEFVDKYKM